MIPNWHAWKNCNIDEGPLANSSLQEISIALKGLEDQKTNYQPFRQMQDVRKRLPIWVTKDRIMDAIFTNPVVIIRGATGCGKNLLETCSTSSV